MEAPLQLSVVVPVYNSVATLAPLVERVAAVCNSLSMRFEVIFVHDGGSQNSWEAIEAVKQAWPDQVVGIQLGRNYGQHNATLCGIDHSRGALVLTMDDDLQHPPEEIPKLIAAMGEGQTDMVYGIPVERRHARWRNVGSAVFKRVFRYMARGLRDGSSFRLLRRSLAEQLGKHREPFVFLDQIIAWYTAQVAYVPVAHAAREEGASGYTGWKLLVFAVKVIILYTDLPLRWMIWTGLVAAVLSLGIGTTYIILKLVNDAAVGFTALITAVTFSASVILLSLGILGEYIGRIYAARTERPAYAVRQVLRD